MNKQEVIQLLSEVSQALNNISVKGEPNLMNLIGSINVIKEIIKSLSQEDKDS